MGFSRDQDNRVKDMEGNYSVANVHRRPVRFAVLLLVLALCVLAQVSGSQGAAFAAGLANSAQATAIAADSGWGSSQGEMKGLPVPSPSPGVPVTGTPDGTNTNGAGWEENALRDFAETLSWPPVVQTEYNGRLMVRKELSVGEWEVASVRIFEFRAAGEAGFAAEQEDARLGGYTLSQETFSQFPAYMAVLTNTQGQVVECRFHWLAQSWVLGVDVHAANLSADDIRALSRQLLATAIQDGMPLPSGTTPTLTPSPTQRITATATPTQAAPGSATPSATSCSVSFTDVNPDMWAYQYINQLACAGVVSGYQDGSFRPQNPTTRAQLTKMLVLMEGIEPVAPQVPSFRDVSRAHVFYSYIETARASGIIAGYSDGRFRPDAPVSRAQVAKMVVRARGWSTEVAAPVSLCDVRPTHWAYSYIEAAIAHGIFTGYGDGCFHPDADATRAQLAKVLVLSHR